MTRRNRMETSAIIITLIGFIAIVVTAAFSLKNILKNNSEEYAAVLTQEIKSSILHELDGTISVANTMAVDPYVIDLFETEEQLGTEKFASELADYTQRMEDGLEYYSICAASDYSRVYVTKDGIFKVMDLSLDEHDIWYENLLLQDSDYYLNMDTDQVHQDKLTAFVNYKIKNDAGDCIGCIAVGMRLSRLQEILQKYESEYYADIYLVDSNGLIQVGMDDASIESQTLDVELKNGIVNTTLDSSSSFQSAEYLASLDWWLVVRDNRGMASVLYQKTIMRIGSIALAVIVIILALILINMRVNSRKIELTAKKEGMTFLSSIYVSMHLIDLRTGEYETLKSNEHIEKLMGKPGAEPFAVQFDRTMRGMALPEQAEGIAQFCDFDTLAKRMEGRKTIYYEFEGKYSGWCRARFIAVDYDVKGLPTKVLYAVEPIDEQKRREEQLKHLSETDLLTNIRNRGSGEAMIRNLMYKGVRGMYVMMDADHFKSINDTYGHATGDEVIKTIATCLELAFRGNDVVFRLGGDEFAVYAPGVMDESTGRSIVERFFTYLDSQVIAGMEEQPINVSVGASIYRENEIMDFDQLYKRADEATYESKKREGNAVTFA